MMRAFIFRLLACFWAVCLFACADLFSKDFLIKSPNGKLSVKLETSKSEEGAPIFLKPEFNHKSSVSLPAIRVGLKTSLGDFSEGLELLSASAPRKLRDDYKMLTGKRSHCKNQAFESVLKFKNPQGREFELVLRAYDDGVAFKYVLSALDGESLREDFSAYKIEDGKKRWASTYDARSYENFYELHSDGGKNARGNDWQYPILIENGDSVFSLISEANIRRGNCASLVSNAGDESLYRVKLADGDLPMEGRWESPWRLMMAGSLADIVESTLVTDLSDPSKLKDTSWIKPGAAAWIYWSHNNSSSDFKVVKEFIDLAAEMSWTYNLIDWKWDKMSNGGDINDAIKYAAQKGVKLMLWYNSSTAWQSPDVAPLYRLNDPAKREGEFKWLSENSIAGIKVDFFDGDGANMMNYYLDLLEDSAKHKIMMNFHGATLPRGWQRTYPHLMTVEAVYGAEWYNNAPVLTDRAAAHNATLVFTRNVVGSMDYTPGTFSDSQHRHITSYAHELALPVLFESGLLHMPDRPSAYRALPENVRKFLSTLPTAWDDTKLLAGYPGEYAVVARRKGKAWYIAGINGTNEPRKLKFDLSKLNISPKSAIIFKDGADSKSFAEQKLENPDSAMEVECLPMGGFAALVR